MKLKQTLVIGLTSAILAIPAIAEVSTADMTHTDATATKPAHHVKKGHKKTALAALDTQEDQAKKSDEPSTPSTDNPANPNPDDAKN